MGLDFLRAKKAQYEQQRDASRLAIDVSDLRERGNPDRVVDLFSVQLRDPSIVVELGRRVLLRFESETHAVAVQNAVVIGDLIPKDAMSLAMKLKRSGKASGMITTLVASLPDISGVFQVKAAAPKDLH